MVAKPEMLGRFMFNSDYPTDKIVWLYEGEFVASSNSNVVWNIPVNTQLGIKVPFFVKGAATIDNWATSIMVGTAYSLPGKNATLQLTWNSSYNNGIHMDANFRSYGGKTVKYRLWGVAREDIALGEDYGKNSGISQTKVKFNTDLNYPRLIKDGVALSGETIQHNLGRIPYVDYWYEVRSLNNPKPKDQGLLDFYEYYPTGTMTSGLGRATIRATDKDITFMKMVVNGNEQRDVIYYYRLYA